MSQTTYNRDFDSFYNNYEWYLPKDQTRIPPETFNQAEKRKNSLEKRWSQWERNAYDPVDKNAPLKALMKPIDPYKPQKITIRSSLRSIFTSDKNKERIMEKLKVEQEFKDRVKTRVQKEKSGIPIKKHVHISHRPHYWQTIDPATRQLTGKDYNLLLAEYRANEMNRLKGDERWLYLVEIYFKHDTCEFTPWFQHILTMKRKWRKEPSNWRTVSWHEIRLHRFPNDCWTLIKGRLYDLTTFLYRHSGGDVPLRQVFGEDGTWVLIGVHPYIVWYHHMAGMEIGRKPRYHQWGWNYYEPIHQFDGFDIFWEWICKKPNPLGEFRPIEKYRQNKSKFFFSFEFGAVANTTEDHWMFTIVDMRFLRIQFYLEGTDIWVGHLKLPITIVNDIPYWKFSNNFNKVTIVVMKVTADKVIPSLKIKKMEYHGWFLSNYTMEYEWFDAYIFKKSYLAENVILLTLGYDMNLYNGVPIGFFVYIKIDDVIRPYCPINFPIIVSQIRNKKLKKRKPGRRGKLTFLIRIHKDGAMTPLLMDTPKDNGKRITEMRISPARGIFNLSFLFDQMEIMLIIAGGTGIAPFIRMIQLYRESAQLGQMSNKHVILMYFNKSEKDIIFGKSFSWLHKVEYKWFHYYPILSQPNRKPTKTWKGLEGRPDKDNIMKCLNDVKGLYNKDKKLKVMICGRYNFIHWAEVELAAMKLTDIKNQFCFLGNMDDDGYSYE